ncbi:MAG: carbonic anhydrase [Synechococcus sp. BS307-5m-G38]|nr:carbonic anhydrase [Synechococcus sp. BS307-5m-G38]
MFLSTVFGNANDISFFEVIDSDYVDSGQGLTKPEDILDELKLGFDRFLNNKSHHPHATQARRHQLAGGQHPQVALLACSDSRVPVEVIFDAGFGDLFVIRNAGNTNTFGSAGSIEYAVLDLQVRVLVVMSHQGCGAVKAAYLKDQAFSASLTELVNDIQIGLTSHGIDINDDNSYPDACIKHATITARSLVDTSEPIRSAVTQKKLLVQPAFLHIDPLQITWLKSFYGSV